MDKVTQFSLRPPELRSLFNDLGDYYRWFVVSNKKIKVANFPDTINPVLSQSFWIDGLQIQIHVSMKAPPKIMSWYEQRLSER